MSGAARVPNDVRRFAQERKDVEGIIQRIGRETWDLILLDTEGNWTRVVLVSKEEAEEAAKSLGVETLHDGWEDDLAKRMNRRDHWNEPGGQKRAL